MRRIAVLLLGLLVLAPAAHALDPSELLPDPALETRARTLSKELRCLVCQNESIDDSNADLARDLRRIVRERLVAGDSDGAVKQYLVARYGDFVLLEPPIKLTTWALWFGPLVVLMLGALGVFVFFRRRQAQPPVVVPPLSAEERRRLDALLEEKTQGSPR
jgi:cytochrome c-type biogenesis protein CcmH